MGTAWRFRIEWEFVSPALRVAAGTVYLERIRPHLSDYGIEEKHSWSVKITEGSVEYIGIIPPVVTEDMKVKLDIMVHSYFSGVKLEKKTYSWLE